MEDALKAQSNSHAIPVEPILVSVADAHQALGIGRTKLYEEINAGRIKIVRFGKRTLIPVEELRAWPSRVMGNQFVE